MPPLTTTPQCTNPAGLPSICFPVLFLCQVSGSGRNGFANIRSHIRHTSLLRKFKRDYQLTSISMLGQGSIKAPNLRELSMYNVHTEGGVPPAVMFFWYCFRNSAFFLTCSKSLWTPPSFEHLVDIQAGVSILRYISISIMIEYSNFSRFYKKKTGSIL